MTNKTILHKAIFEHDGRYFVYADILMALKHAGLKMGDSVFVHSDLKSFGKIVTPILREEYIKYFINAIFEAVGSTGNVLMPTFSYSFTKNEEFNPKSTPSTIGIMPEYFRTMPGVERSLDPIFSIAATGVNKSYFTDVHTDCFGKNSIFEKLFDKNARLVFLGQTFDMTYIHFVEQRFGVPYRYKKKFSGNIRVDGKTVSRTVEYNVRSLEQPVTYNLEGIASYLALCGVLTRAPLGYSQIRTVPAADVFHAIWMGLEKNVYFLLNEKI